MPERDDRHASVPLRDLAIDPVGVLHDAIPPIAVGLVTRLSTLGDASAVPAVIVRVGAVSGLRERLGELERLKLKLPEAETAESVGVRQEEKPPEVKVAADGSIWIDDQIVPEMELESRIRQLVERAPDDGIILKGDKGADYGVVVHVLDVARKVGAKGIQMSADRPADQ